jgi:hypothetical protein
MLFSVENDIFLWICLVWPTSSKNDVYISITISRGTPGEKPCLRQFRIGNASDKREIFGYQSGVYKDDRQPSGL